MSNATQSQIIKSSTATRIVPTKANTPLTEWVAMLRARLADFKHVPVDFVSDLRAQHACEGFASHIEKQVTLRERTKTIKLNNPQNYKD